METDQYIDLISHIKEIRDAILEKKKPENSMDLVYQLRDGIFHQLETKTGWGISQIKEMIDNLIDTL